MSQEEIHQQRRTKREALTGLAVEPYGRAFARTPVRDITVDDKDVACAGRIMAFRRHGKTSFLDLTDWTGKIQLYFKTDQLAEPERAVFELLDIGDIIGAEGDVFRTRTGELTIMVKKFRVLSKSLNPLPEKWHGLKDVETRFRQRYVDLIMNQDVREIFRKRILTVQYMREFLHERGFYEVETPMMQPIPGGAEARPFITYHNTLDMNLYLRVAPELYLKRLLVGGFEKVFEINRNFRNEGISPRHNPEFTMLELYSAYDDYRVMMAITEALISKVTERLNGSLRLAHPDGEIDLTGPWKTMTWAESFASVGISDWQDRNAVLRKVEEWHLEVIEEDKESLYGLLETIFEKKVQPGLRNPTFITEYPRDISPLAKSCPDRPDMTERFELYIGGMELANAYSELNDPVEQHRRFEEEVKTQRPDRPKTVDTDYIDALGYGMPPAGGLGIGIDRLVMLLTGASSIREVILFPLLRHKEE